VKIGVISDTHGDQLAIKRAVAVVGPVDLWLHAGDYSQDARFITRISAGKVIAAAGNCDGSTAVGKIDEFIDVGGKKIWLTHGHRYNVKNGHHELAWWARQFEADIVVYGHSHIPEVAWVQDLLVFNPGSAAHPRWHIPTCGLIEIHEGKVNAQILDIT